MVVVETADRAFCIDRFEASLVEVLADGSEQPYPHYKPVDGHAVRAASVPDVFPQGFISEVQAEDACSASGKRLCRHAEWKTACMGPDKTAFPYGEARQAGTCHDQGKSAVLAVFGAKAVLASTPYGIAPTSPAKGGAAKPGKKPAHVTTGRAAQTVKTRPAKAGATATKATAGKPPSKTTKKRVTGKASTRPSNVDPGVWAKLNEPALGQVEGALAKTGAHPACVNAFGAEDMVGNLHEWVATDVSLPHGTFAGGYYLDTALNGDGCNYKTVAHAHDYHDYSTGFRCCADLAAAPPTR
jgi:formylglycine-generating enzyme required for sulfatase activity